MKKRLLIRSDIESVMRTSDTHLEEALQEYNDKVNALEAEGGTEELLEALVNRSTVLMLMGSYVSSLDDLEEAMDIMDEMIGNSFMPEKRACWMMPT